MHFKMVTDLLKEVLKIPLEIKSRLRHKFLPEDLIGKKLFTFIFSVGKSFFLNFILKQNNLSIDFFQKKLFTY